MDHIDEYVLLKAVVPVQSGMELIFIAAAWMVLCFSSMTNLPWIALTAIADQCLHSIRACSLSHTAASLPVTRLGRHKRLGGTQPGR